ncbi:hypothetical protein SNEBB_001556 [Seison nebaliae]|nr:hypothetical protein SNEBB_001556 [Seison nebaliae]
MFNNGSEYRANSQLICNDESTGEQPQERRPLKVTNTITKSSLSPTARHAYSGIHNYNNIDADKTSTIGRKKAPVAGVGTARTKALNQQFLTEKKENVRRNDAAKKLGLTGLFDRPKKFKNQDYNKIRKDLLKSKTLFEDPEFPADDKSLFHSQSIRGIDWKRPGDICPNPKLFVDGISQNDVYQGQLGNCWFVAACSVLATEKSIWNKVIPNWKDQEWNEDNAKNYQGIFRFNFWRFGEWIEVVIDDQLPTIGGQLIFIRSKSKNEFWSALLEKAYAKLNGCYENLDGGNLQEALTDFTGGVAEPISIIDGGYARDAEKREALFQLLKNEYDYRSLMACAINIKSAEQMEVTLPCGLIKGHAYGITSVKRLKIREEAVLSFLAGVKEEVMLIRIRNPWGDKEWNGPWSHNSDEWKQVPDHQRQRLGLTFDDDGEFWMEFSDFCQYFTDVAICRIVNTSFFSLRKTWSEALAIGSWSPPNRNGGCINNKSTFFNNPQYRFDISKSEDLVLINLIQHDLRYVRGQGITNLTIGFYIMKVEENRIYRLKEIKPKAGVSTYINTRSVFLRTYLPYGRYVIIPSTFDPNIDGNFLLRIYSDQFCNLTELIEDHPKVGCCSGPVKCSTLVHVKRAENLNRPSNVIGEPKKLKGKETNKNMDPYVIIKCDKENVQSAAVSNSDNPEWNMSAIFYRKKTKKPIVVQVYDKNELARDEFIGQVEIDAEIDSGKKTLHLSLDNSTAEKKRQRSLKKMSAEDRDLELATAQMNVLNSNDDDMARTELQRLAGNGYGAIYVDVLTKACEKKS